jgi:isopenicillin N synthase-like dioxygenase
MTRPSRLSELALGLPAGHFAPFYREPGCSLRLAFYPAGEGQSGQDRYGAHTD